MRNRYSLEEHILDSLELIPTGEYICMSVEEKACAIQMAKNKRIKIIKNFNTSYEHIKYEDGTVIIANINTDIICTKC